MRPLRYSINVTLDGCVDHREGSPSEELHRHVIESFARTTYQMMEEAWRPVAETGIRPEWMPAWMEPFAHAIHKLPKYVVSNTLERVDWNAELLRGDLTAAIQQLKQTPGRGLHLGGVTLPLALAERGLIDEYTFIVHPNIAGHGPRLFDGLSKPLALRLVNRQEFKSGAQVLSYVPRESQPDA
jgi:dihydrofolate reductase